tara:strand:- start:145 stop:348 length:204 start_codon:yes stop_codon:yes gene_type:complete
MAKKSYTARVFLVDGIIKPLFLGHSWGTWKALALLHIGFDNQPRMMRGTVTPYLGQNFGSGREMGNI